MTRDKRFKTLEKIYEKYPDVWDKAGYIPKWVIFFEGRPVISKIIIIILGLALGVMSTLPIWLK